MIPDARELLCEDIAGTLGRIEGLQTRMIEQSSRKAMADAGLSPESKIHFLMCVYRVLEADLEALMEGDA